MIAHPGALTRDCCEGVSKFPRSAVSTVNCSLTGIKSSDSVSPRKQRLQLTAHPVLLSPRSVTAHLPLTDHGSPQTGSFEGFPLMGLGEEIDIVP